MTFDPRLGALRRALPALLALAVFALGAAAHERHHLDDPACDSGATAHPCVACAGLHGGNEAGETASLAAPEPPQRPLQAHRLACAGPAERVLGPSAPRAPPIS